MKVREMVIKGVPFYIHSEAHTERLEGQLICEMGEEAQDASASAFEDRLCGGNNESLHLHRQKDSFSSSYESHS